MVVEYTIIDNVYRDSVELMRVADDVARTYDLSDAFALMGTEANRDQLIETKAIDAESLSDLGPEDLVLVAVASDEECAEQAVSDMQTRLDSGDPNQETDEPGSQLPESLSAAIDQLENPEIALISVPGQYAVREAWLALHAGLHVHLFSDNVPVSDERELKEFGRANDQLVMGSDCGTALVDGIPLGFANVVSRGSIGIVSASGTGLQEVATLLDRAGAGVSQAIGTGGRDLHDAVGGLATSQAIERLDADGGTESIVVISKPPEPEARAAVLKTVSASETPVIVHFLGTDSADIESAGATPAETLTEAATLAAESSASTVASPTASEADDLVTAIESKMRGSGGDVRGLFAGGTLCTETALVLSDRLDEIATNVGVGNTLEDPREWSGHALVDLGADEFTRGRPHPMIEPGLRDGQFEATLYDDAVGVVLLDIVLGRGVHGDPVAGIIEALDAASSPPPVVASVCGTDADPQSRAEQVERLEQAGVLVAPSNAAAAAAVGDAIGGNVSSGGVRQ